MDGSRKDLSLRSQRADVAAIWCRRVAGLFVWGFVGIIISQLWTVAWRLRDLKLLALCLLITTSLLYIFYKRYRHIREIGLTGVDLVRAMTVDEGEMNGLHGVTRKARASCVDFKFDPMATFQEKPLGRGFEPYPPPPEATAEAEAPNSPDGDGDDGDDGKSAGRKRRRGIIPWLSWWGRNDQEIFPEEMSMSSDEPSTSASYPSGAIVADGEEIAVPSCGESASHDDLSRAFCSVSVEAGPVVEAVMTGSASGGDAGVEAAEAGASVSEGAWEATETRTGPGARGGQVVRACELNPSCSICLFEYYLDEEVTLLPCGHLYHTECIDIWMSDHVDCPYCRADINVWATIGGHAAANGAGAGSSPNRAGPETAAAVSGRVFTAPVSAVPASAGASTTILRARPALPVEVARETDADSREVDIPLAAGWRFGLPEGCRPIGWCCDFGHPFSGRQARRPARTAHLSTP